MAIYDGDNAKIFYETKKSDASNGCWVTLVNGFLRSSSDFRQMATYFNRRGFHVLLLDNRGSGQTVHHGEFTLEDVAADILGIWQQEGIDRSHIVGLSMGGYIAQLVTFRKPQAVLTLSLVSTSGRLPAVISHEPWGQDSKAIRTRLDGYFHKEFAEENASLVQAMAKQMAEENRDGSLEKRAQKQRTAIGKTEVAPDRLRLVSVPTLVLHGDSDEIIPIEEARVLVRTIPGAMFHVFSEAGHLLLAERAKELYDVIADFLESQPSS